MEQMTTLRDLVGQAIQKKEEEKRIAEEQAAKDRSWKIPICYDDDEDNTIAITPVYQSRIPITLKGSSGESTTHVDFSQYDSFIFDLSNDQFPPADRSDLNHEEFADELTHIIMCLSTNVNVTLEDDQSSLFAYVVWIFLAFLTYPVVPPYLLSTRNEDTIFDPGISIYHSFMPDDFPDCEDSRASSIHKSFTSSASF
ncbi:hypothetical protein Tco_0001866 [Tanacetum coccineum]